MNISIKKCLLELFLDPYEAANGEELRLLGIALIRIGTGIGVYFLFEGSAPFFRYLGGGENISVLLFLGGSFLIYFNRKKKSISKD